MAKLILCKLLSSFDQAMKFERTFKSFSLSFNRWEIKVGELSRVNSRSRLTYTRKNLTAYQQDVFALPVPSWNKLLSFCDKVEEANRLATSRSNKSDSRL